MGLRIGTNLPSLAAQRSLYQTQKTTERAMKQLASGNRFSDISEGSADFAIAEQLRAQMRGMSAARNNAQNATSFVQVAEGGLNEQNNLLIRMRELAIQSASDTYDDTQREFLDTEFQELKKEFDRIAKTTAFGSQKLLDGTEKDYEFQVGVNRDSDNIIKYKSGTNTTSGSLSIAGLSVLDRDEARDSLDDIDNAMNQISKARSNYGAIQSRFDSVVNYTDEQVENLAAAHSNIADTDVAKAVSEVTKGMALQQYQTAVLAQANQWPGAILKLIA